MVSRWRLYILSVVLLPLLVSGCVSPETAKKIDALEEAVKQVVADHKAGRISTDEAVPRLESLVAQIKELKQTGEPWYNMLGYWVLTTLATVMGARKLGIPGIAHGTGLPIGTLNGK